MAAWRDTYEGLLRDETIEAFVERAYSSERVARRIAEDAFQVALDGPRIIAFADALERDDHVDLLAIYALPAERGHGAGTRLLESLRTRFPGLMIVADVLVGNRKGEVFYERRGFIVGETIEADLFGERVVERRWRLPSVPGD